MVHPVPIKEASARKRLRKPLLQHKCARKIKLWSRKQRVRMCESMLLVRA